MLNILVLLEFKFAEVSTTLKMMQAISLKQAESLVYTKTHNNKLHYTSILKTINKHRVYKKY